MAIKRTLNLMVILTVTFMFVSPGQAIESGTDASGNSIVVPIITEVGLGKVANCSGALLMPTLVITAGHCLLDSNGQGADNIRVGPPGSNFIFDDNTWAKVTDTYFTVDYQGSGLNNTVTPGDIAVIVLNKAYEINTNLTIASENQLISIKNASSKLRMIGYGYISDSGQTAITPNFFDSIYTSLIANDPNQSLAESTTGNPCAGDSGGPVLYITPTRTMLIGVITGGYFSNKCSKKQSNGKYLTAFTVVNRYANLALAGATKSLTAKIATETQANKTILQLQSELLNNKSNLAKLQDDFNQLKVDYENLKSSSAAELKDLALQNEILKKMIPKTIICIKGKSTKKVTAVNPDCPTGYTRK